MKQILIISVLAMALLLFGCAEKQELVIPDSLPAPPPPDTPPASNEGGALAGQAWAAGSADPAPYFTINPEVLLFEKILDTQILHAELTPELLALDEVLYSNGYYWSNGGWKLFKFNVPDSALAKAITATDETGDAVGYFVQQGDIGDLLKKDLDLTFGELNEGDKNYILGIQCTLVPAWKDAEGNIYYEDNPNLDLTETSVPDCSRGWMAHQFNVELKKCTDNLDCPTGESCILSTGKCTGGIVAPKEPEAELSGSLMSIEAYNCLNLDNPTCFDNCEIGSKVYYCDEDFQHTSAEIGTFVGVYCTESPDGNLWDDVGSSMIVCDPIVNCFNPNYVCQEYAGPDVSCGTKISDEDMFILSGTQFQLKGADAMTKTEPKIRYKNMVTGETIESSSELRALASMTHNGERYHFWSYSDYGTDDFIINLVTPCDLGIESCQKEISLGDTVNRGGFNFKYLGADGMSTTNPKMKILNLDTSDTIEMDLNIVATANIHYRGQTRYFESDSEEDYNVDDFGIRLFSPCY